MLALSKNFKALPGLVFQFVRCVYFLGSHVHSYPAKAHVFTGGTWDREVVGTSSPEIRND